MSNEKNPPILSLADFLPYRLNVLSTEVSEGLAHHYAAKFDIGVAEWRVLATVGEFGKFTAKAIGAQAHMDKVKVSRAVASLETRKLIERRANPDDRREAFIVLSDTGKRMYAEIVPIAHDYVSRITRKISDAELNELNRLMDKLRASIDGAAAPSAGD